MNRYLWHRAWCHPAWLKVIKHPIFFRYTKPTLVHGPPLLTVYTVYPKKYAHGFCFPLLCCGYTLTDFPISIRLTSLALWQSNDCPSASKATLMNMDKYFMWIHYERLHNHNKAKHNKTVCIFLGIYCSWGRNDTRAWISNCNHTKQHDVITVPCPNFNGVLTGWVITFHSNNGCDFYPNPTLSRSLPLKWPPIISILYNNVPQCFFYQYKHQRRLIERRLSFRHCDLVTPIVGIDLGQHWLR